MHPRPCVSPPKTAATNAAPPWPGPTPPTAAFARRGVTPWLPVNPDYAQGINVAGQISDPDSLLSFYKKMLHIRKEHPALIWGEYQALYEESDGFPGLLAPRPAAEMPGDAEYGG